MRDNTGLVQAQVDAYNDRDASALAGCYASDAVIDRHDGTPMMTGRDEIEHAYSQLFDQSPDIHVDIVNRIAAGDWVVDEKQARGVVFDGLPSEVHGLVS